MGSGESKNSEVDNQPPMVGHPPVAQYNEKTGASPNGVLPPQQGIPQFQVPQQGMPQLPMPQQGMPQFPMPQQGMPQFPMPQQGVPQSSMPQQPMKPKPQGPPPPARPPQRRKTQVFRVEDYQHVDDFVFKAPESFTCGTFRQLVAYLTSDPTWDDMAKVRAIFRWVTSVDVFSLNLEHRPPKQSPMEYFIKIKEGTGNHAHLFNAFCKMANIPCEIVVGMNKSAAYQIGKQVDRQTMGAQWNAVFVAGDWRFVDAFWASSCVVGKKTGEWALMEAEGNAEDNDEEATEGTTTHRINEFYFLPDPEQLIWTHFPDKTEWQLLETPITVDLYQEHFYVRERFHIFGMSETPQSKRQCVLTTTDGEVHIEFTLPPEKSSNFRFKHMLYRSRTAISEDSAIDTMLERFVMFEYYEDLVRFSLRFPVKGTFKMDIYGLDINESEMFDLCCSYVIECPQAKVNCVPLPDCPALGWGPGQKTIEAGLSPVSHKNAKVVADNGCAEIRLDKKTPLVLHQQLKHAVLDDSTLSKYCLTRVEDGQIVMYLSLPQNGEFALKLFAQQPETEGEADNVLNYLVECEGNTENNKPFPNTSHGILGKGPDVKRFKVKALSHEGGTIDTTDGKGKIQFNGRVRWSGESLPGLRNAVATVDTLETVVGKKTQVSVKFKAKKKVELVCEVHTVDSSAAKLVTVTRHNEDGEWKFDLDLPASGDYSLNVFAKSKNNPRELNNVHTYLVHSDGQQSVDQDEVKTDEADAGNIIRNETVETSDKEAYIPVPWDCANALGEFHRRKGQHTSDAQPLELVEAADMSLFRLHLDDFTEYMLNVYTEFEPDSGRVRNVAKYQVNRRRPGELYSGNISALMDTLQEEGPQDDGDGDLEDIDDDIEKKASPEHKERQNQARKAVQQAMDLKDHKQLESALARYKDAEVPEDDPILVRAQKLLIALQSKADLMEASQARNIKALDDALKHAREVNFEHQLDLQIAMAARLHEHLTRLEKLRHAVLNMDQKTVAELKTYVKPPVGVHESMMSTFLLLGSTLKEVKAQGMVDEVESYGGAEGADQLRLQK